MDVDTFAVERPNPSRLTIPTTVVTTIWFVAQSDVPQGPILGETIHFTLIRLFLLSVIAGLATFTIRMLRAYLHIAEKNRHRVRVANSMESFLQSTVEPEQRDLILAKLTDSIVNFGDSGLVREREEHSSTMSGDLIGRIVSAISGKGG